MNTTKDIATFTIKNTFKNGKKNLSNPNITSKRQQFAALRFCLCLNKYEVKQKHKLLSGSRDTQKVEKNITDLRALYNINNVYIVY